MGIGRLVMGTVGILLLAAVPATWRGRTWFGSVVSLQQGRVALQFATPNMLSTEQQARYRPGAWRIRASMQAVLAGLLLAGAVSASAYSLGRSAVIVLVHALLALKGRQALARYRGADAMASGRRLSSVVTWFRTGRASETAGRSVRTRTLATAA